MEVKTDTDVEVLVDKFAEDYDLGPKKTIELKGQMKAVLAMGVVSIMYII